jgi:16S rRNA C967 or C1407 C5-methylase (RsmB/RsmF family)/NOL1/NOP2/fmu family ribosome biogenesis protein
LLPDTFIASLQGLPGFDQEAFIKAHEQQEQLTSLRLNRFKSFELGGHTLLNDKEAIPWCNNGFYLKQRPLFVLDPLWHAGAYYVQEASSMFIQYLLEQVIPYPQPMKVLDLCAAPGGKTTLLANYFSNGLVVANETIKPRNAILVENLTKWGADNIVVTQNDPTHFKALPDFFDVLMIDAPCSGSGLFRKDTEAIAHWSEQSVQHCSTRQARIVEDSIDCLKEGGYLIYSTCSYSSEENEKRMDQIAAIAGMKNIQFDIPSHWNIVTTYSEENKCQGFRFYPDKVKGEGFFITVFKKETSTSSGYYDTTPTSIVATKKELEVIKSHFEVPENYDYINHQNSILALPHLFQQELNGLMNHLYIKKMGLSLGEIKGADLIPSHALAMSTWSNLPYQTLEVDEATALQYLRRADLHLPTGKGWHTLTFKNIRLGWAKLLPNRSNNYYPNEWRILNY